MQDFLFADDAAIVAQSVEDLQQFMNRFSKACHDFGLTISLKKIQVMGQGVDSPSFITISVQELFMALCTLAQQSLTFSP